MRGQLDCCSEFIGCLDWEVGCAVFMNLISVFICCAVSWVTDRLYHAEGHTGVKFILNFEVSVKINDEYSSCSTAISRRIRNDSRMYETAGSGEEFTGEDFQNTGTFIVVRSSVFVKNSGHKTHLARDAYSAFWDFPGWSQERNCSLGSWLEGGDA